MDETQREQIEWAAGEYALACGAIYEIYGFALQTFMERLSAILDKPNAVTALEDNGQRHT